MKDLLSLLLICCLSLPTYAQSLDRMSLGVSGGSGSNANVQLSWTLGNAFTGTGEPSFYAGWGFQQASDPVASFPVEWLSFEAYHEGQNVDLQWITGAEINNDFYDVERSLDGLSYQKLGRVPGRGNTQEISTYEYRDLGAALGPWPILYYRLKQVDFNGQFQYSQTVTVRFAEQAYPQLSIFPNPSDGHCQLQWAGLKNESLKLRLFDTRGQLCWAKDWDQAPKRNLVKLDFSQLPEGVYYLRGEQAEFYESIPIVLVR